MTADANAESEVVVVLSATTPDEQSTDLTTQLHNLGDDEMNVDIHRMVAMSVEDLICVERSILTDRQYETLKLAWDHGYYEVPRRTDLQELSDRLGVSRSAVSQRLTTAETKLVGLVIEDHGVLTGTVDPGDIPADDEST